MDGLIEIRNSCFPRLSGRTGLASIILVYLLLVLTLPSQFSPGVHSCIPGGSSGKWLPARLPRLPNYQDLECPPPLVLGPVTSGFGGIPIVGNQKAIPFPSTEPHDKGCDKGIWAISVYGDSLGFSPVECLGQS